MAGNIARRLPPLGESWPHDMPPPESDRISERRRDLLALDIDGAALPPPDESGHGFDNVTVGDRADAPRPLHLGRAENQPPAIGTESFSRATSFACRPTSQEDHLPGLPRARAAERRCPHSSGRRVRSSLARARLEGSVSGLRNRVRTTVVLVTGRWSRTSRSKSPPTPTPRC